MRPADPFRTGVLPPATPEASALENLRFLRETMERAASFPAVPGRGTAAVGATALLASFAAARAASPGAWIAIWLAEAALAVAIGAGATALKARRAGVSVFAGAGWRFLLNLVPPMVAGAILTLVLYRAGQAALIPGLWLLLYGAGLVTGGAFTLRALRVMGLAFMGVGALALLAPFVSPDGFLAAGFGGLHIAFGLWIARKHGG
jgi:hypothetical protein